MKKCMLCFQKKPDMVKVKITGLELGSDLRDAMYVCRVCAKKQGMPERRGPAFDRWFANIIDAPAEALKAPVKDLKT